MDAVKMISRRRALAGGAVAAAVPLVHAKADASHPGTTTELTVPSAGGSFAKAWEKVVLGPFRVAYPDIRVRTVTGISAEIAAMARAQRNDVKLDVLRGDEPFATELAAQGIFHPLSASAVPNLDLLYPQFRVKGDAYADLYFYGLCLTYDTQKVTGVPHSWRDLWNPRYKGMIAVPDITTSQGPMFLLVLARMNGGSATNIDPAFAALKTLKPNILTFWTQHAQVAQMFVQGEIAMAPWVPDRTDDLIESGGHVAWTIPDEKTALAISWIGIAKGSKHIAAAEKYVNFTLSTRAQEGIAKYVHLSPVNRMVELSPEVASKIVFGPKELAKTFSIDWAVVARDLPKWVDRWNREIANP